MTVEMGGNSNARAQETYIISTSTSGSGGSGVLGDAVIPSVGVMLGCTLSLAVLWATYLRRHHIVHALTRCWRVLTSPISLSPSRCFRKRSEKTVHCGGMLLLRRCVMCVCNAP